MWGRTVVRRGRAARGGVSIHAPVWGRTGLAGSPFGGSCPFQSTPPCGGERRRFRSSRQRCRCFNPRPRVGANGIRPTHHRRDEQFQSTPPCGGEPRLTIRPRGPLSFNPRPRVGANDCLVVVVMASKEFQSTPPCGGEPRWSGRSGSFLSSFNPRPRVGANPLVHCTGDQGRAVSIHAPVWGRTYLHPHALPDLPYVSIHAPVWGRTAAGVARGGTRPSFNPRPRVGANPLEDSP